MRDSLDGIAVFVEVVAAGSFARAAEGLGLTRSAVAKNIARIESRLGVRLFERTTRRQDLTSEGAIYYECCVRALEKLRSAEAQVHNRHDAGGKLKVSVPVLFGRNRCLAPTLPCLA
ncbi:HTH-type transcriptional regulator CynR [compost metagenome]